MIVLIGLFAISCATENQYFKKSLSESDKEYLKSNDTLIKEFSGKANWHKQYWTGNLLIVNNDKGIEIKEIGEWRQTSKDGHDVYTITNFDKFGYLVDEIILGGEGMPLLGETYCKRDTSNGQVRLVCDVINRYYNGQISERGQRVIINEVATKEGNWEYFTESGALYKIVNYKNDKPVQ